MKFILSVLIAATLIGSTAMAEEIPQTVSFPSADGKTTLVGYLFLPSDAKSAKMGAVVMLHGRAGAYSSLADGEYDARTLSKRHMFWGHHWASLGYTALLVDSFGPRGYPAGFPIHSYEDRPEEVSELSVRPFDAYGALAYLRTRPDVDGHRVALQGWSNGGSATIAAIADVTLGSLGMKPREGFRGAVAFYPACRMHDTFKDRYHPYAGLRIFSGDNDEEVNAQTCAKLVETSRKDNGDIGIEVLPGATHGFDDPGKKRQSIPANAEALRIVVPRVTDYIRGLIGEDDVAPR